jgi:hypothetical protein
MNENDKLNEANFLIYAMHHYDNTQCYSLAEFEDDLKKFLYLKKLISRYKNNGDLKERLILNHIIVLYNLFGEATTKMLFYKVDEECWDVLTTFLVYLNLMPEIIVDYGIILSEVILDENVISKLRNI